ncbi:MAG TPA: amidohydrolase family protein [Candidatus Enterocloster faecavium]|mgnify:CR=1 FL=1|uniref:Amidohydrolase family protein n=1 Tax=Candidatus Enterocloster faecavium TaxID=2838560 RepID=A0A9D2L6H3_9FIRM|nr:amidohydrolase family protein [Candidatus Enterocloster faecavium]
MKSCDLLIKDTTALIKSICLMEHVDIAIGDGKILEVGEELGTCYQAGEQIDGRYKLFMPGLIDSHMHTGQQLLKGRVLDAKPIIWTRIMLPFESTMTPERMALSARLAALEMIKSGTTGFVDAGSYFMEEAAGVFAESGLRGAISCSTMDEEGLPQSIAMNAREAVAQTDRLYDAFHGKGNLKVYYALRALNSCSTELALKAAEHAREHNTMLQAHMNEYQGEVDGIIAREGMRPYEYLEKLGILDKHFLGAHSLLLSEREKELIQERGAVLCHCPFSNCGKAVPDTPDLLARGIMVGMGSDGAAHGGLSLWNEMKIFRSVMNICKGVPQKNPSIMPAATILKMVLEGGAAALDEKGSLGQLKEGFKADLISINLRQPHLMPTGNLINTLLEIVTAGDVADSIVGGRVVMKDREVKTLDEEKILREAEQYGKEGSARWNFG